MSVEDDTPPETPEWIVTYGDMMSLLLTFFVMIASFSEVREQEKYQAVASSMRQQFGHDLTNGTVVPGWTRPRSAMLASLATLARTEKHQLIGNPQEGAEASGQRLPQKILRTKEFLEQELGIPADRIRISASTGKEAKFEIYLMRETEEE